MRDQCGEAGYKVERIEQYVRGTVSERVFQFMDHQAIFIDAQSL